MQKAVAGVEAPECVGAGLVQAPPAGGVTHRAVLPSWQRTMAGTSHQSSQSRARASLVQDAVALEAEPGTVGGAEDDGVLGSGLRILLGKFVGATGGDAGRHPPEQA